MDQAFERLMQRVPGFEPDPPEMEIIQQELEKTQQKPGKTQQELGPAEIRKERKGETSDVL